MIKKVGFNFLNSNHKWLLSSFESDPTTISIQIVTLFFFLSLATWLKKTSLLFFATVSSKTVLVLSSKSSMDQAFSKLFNAPSSNNQTCKICLSHLRSEFRDDCKIPLNFFLSKCVASSTVNSLLSYFIALVTETPTILSNK